jgi:hypothetical protein
MFTVSHVSLSEDQELSLSVLSHFSQHGIQRSMRILKWHLDFQVIMNIFAKVGEQDLTLFSSLLA